MRFRSSFLYTGPTSTSSYASTISSRGGKQEQIEGRVEGFPATPSGAFVVDGRTVRTTSITSFQLGNSIGSFADLAIGQRVYVTGTSTTGDLVASAVRIQNVQVDLPVTLNGVMLISRAAPRHSR